MLMDRRANSITGPNLFKNCERLAPEDLDALPPILKHTWARNAGVEKDDRAVPHERHLGAEYWSKYVTQHGDGSVVLSVVREDDERINGNTLSLIIPRQPLPPWENLAARAGCFLPASRGSLFKGAYDLSADTRATTTPSSLPSVHHQTAVVSVEIPGDVQCIENHCFAGFSKLQKVFIPPSVTKICKEAFLSCNMLEELVIPPAVSRIHVGAFANCGSLKAVSFPGWKEYAPFSRHYASDIFRGSSKVAVVDAPNSIIKQLDGVCQGISKFKDLPLACRGPAAISVSTPNQSPDPSKTKQTNQRTATKGLSNHLRRLWSEPPLWCSLTDAPSNPVKGR